MTDVDPATTETVSATELAVCAHGETLTSYGLGSCLAIALYDPDTAIGGLAHALLPTSADSLECEEPPGKYTDTAIRTLREQLLNYGATESTLEAKLAGGSDMLSFDTDRPNVGRRNIDVAREELATLGVRVVGTDVGGDYGRTVAFSGRSGELTVTSNADAGHTDRIL